MLTDGAAVRFFLLAFLDIGIRRPRAKYLISPNRRPVYLNSSHNRYCILVGLILGPWHAQRFRFDPRFIFVCTCF
ncbi:hypothetical protein EYC84_010327 [Monilinia fructicola]|uniref:Uncharacterized protein n=1 Tax=Monilinia fructicola TaxID=38448 RepID=A0A5M9JD70_MONFR|nr:hypothetical protein EYC84_010327 [Monilinia fructicola]